MGRKAVPNLKRKHGEKNSPEKVFNIQDLNQFRSLKIDPPGTSKKSSSSRSPKKIYSILQSPSVGGLFADDDQYEEESSNEELENHSVSQWLSHGRKV
ncbi:hypothetical protein I4U23_027736 [Adineta vaga]|nr:hypothetical protein I4U23_027736 [Adineta vaga]